MVGDAAIPATVGQVTAITARAMAIHTTGLAITVTVPVGALIRTTDIIRADTTLTAMDTRRT